MDFPRDVPTLRAGPVTLRAARSEDADGVVEQCADPVSIRWTTVPRAYTREDALAFLTRRIPEGWREGSSCTFVVEVTGDDDVPRFAGTVALHDEGDRRAEVAYGAHPRARGRGVMVEAVRLLLEWGFADRGVQTVVWWANTGNWASRKLAWRLGFAFGGEVRQWLPQRGELIDGWIGTLRAGDPMAPAHPWYDVPRLVGQNVVLRRYRSDDAARVVEACTDPETRRWLGMLPSPYGLAEADLFLRTREEQHASGTAVHWAVADPRDDRLTGSISLFDIRRGVDAELGYWVHPAARRRGVGTGASRLALGHAFRTLEDGGLGLGRVRALAAEGNTASRRVLERAEMSLQGRERRVVVVGGGLLADAAVYDVLAEEVTGWRGPR